MMSDRSWFNFVVTSKPIVCGDVVLDSTVTNSVSDVFVHANQHTWLVM